MVEILNRNNELANQWTVSDTEPSYKELMVGLDVGSTTVKAVVMDPETDEILWKDYERHQTKQPEKVFEFLKRIEAAFPTLPQDKFRIFITGSGGNMLREYIGAKFVQEVNAVSLAVENLYPDAGSVIELGGAGRQDNHLVQRPRKRHEAENSQHERQVRRRYGGCH